MNQQVLRTILLMSLFVAVFTLSAGKIYSEDKKPKKAKQKKIQISLLSIQQKIIALPEDEEFVASPSAVTVRWLPLIMSVREGKIKRQDAVDSMNHFTNDLWDRMEAFVRKGKMKKYSDNDWVFPVRGYTASAIGGSNGSGYISQGFDFFEQNSGGHPAHDIFISDANQDCLEDNTGEPVEILSMSGGIVVETRKNWTPDMMDIRGGNIVYVYDNFTNGFFYYAHLKEVYVNAGDIVSPGKVLGIMGRTGRNAYPSRSPTHLHIMYVRSHDGELIPENLYNDLLKAKTIP